ncbi:MAG: hypothetical protein AAF108_11505 [Planctomycetota bacterium]
MKSSPRGHGGLDTPRPAPLWAVLTVTFLGSIGTGCVGNGLFFIAKSQHGFDHAQSFGLGLTLGLAYIPAALVVGPALRRLVRVSNKVTTRGVVFVQAVLLAGSCFALRTLGDSEWAVWVFAAAYGGITGAHWPLVESYLSGGRKDAALRTAVGRFNIVWTLAVAIAIFGMTPLIERHPMEVIGALGVGHLVSLAAVWRFPAEPMGHPPDTPHRVPDSFRTLLVVNRVLLPVSYVLLSALNPYWPNAFESIGVVGGAQTALASVWMFARFLTVIALERWHGWHGTRATPALGAVMLGLGFSIGVALPGLGSTLSSGAGVGLAVVVLILFGIGMGIIYTGALYYGLEVGTDGVDDGGAHEGLIGLGYATGPLLGLVAVQTESAGFVAEGGFRWVLLGLAGAVFAAAAAYAARAASTRRVSAKP